MPFECIQVHGADILRLAARAALKRKKQHEHTLEQTTAQVATLEQQIYSIEAANINRETLAAMEKAGKAMADIHGKLNIDKVDETMYVTAQIPPLSDMMLTFNVGRNSENNTRWVKKSRTLSRTHLSVKQSMRESWMMSWQSWSKSSWTIRCSRLVLYQSQMISTGYHQSRMERVSHVRAMPTYTFY